MTALGYCIEDKARKGTTTHQTYCTITNLLQLLPTYFIDPDHWKKLLEQFWNIPGAWGINNQTQNENYTE